MSDCCGGNARGAWIQGIAEKAARPAEPPGALREAIEAVLCRFDVRGVTTQRVADALLSGPLADVLAENARLRGVEQRVEALADELETGTRPGLMGFAYDQMADRLRAALASPAPAPQGEEPTDCGCGVPGCVWGHGA